jgi:putative ATP-binding cassette transporter
MSEAEHRSRQPDLPRRSRPRFLRQVLRLAGPYWNSQRRWQARGVTVLLLLLTFAQVGLAVWTNYWNRALFDALEQRDVREVFVQVAVFGVIFGLTIAVTAAHLRVKRWLQLDWRAWLTDQLIGRWLERGRHYQLPFRPGEHDNPDARIAEDIRIATETAIALGHTLVYSLLSFGLFVGILWEVSGALQIPGTDVHVPGYLVPLAFLYAGLGAVIGWGFGRPLVRSTNALQTAEADFRFGLARVREHAEPIALLHGEPIERAAATGRFRQIVHDWNRQSLAYMGIVGFSTGYGALLPVFPILVAAPQYVLGVMSLGMLMQAAQAFQKLNSSLSWFTDNLGDIARTRASADRVLTLYEAMQRLDEPFEPRDGHRIVVAHGAKSRLVIDDLCIAEPSGRILIEDVCCRIEPGERVLVAGDPAVTGSFFKVLGGLWPWGSGAVLLPGDDDVLFMPQRPFLPQGTLRAALCYPLAPEAFAAADLARALECAGLAWLVPRLDDQDNWEQALPLRAQQRLGFARALLRRPAWIFMEEATDAFDADGERQILETLYRELPDCGVLVISFHTGLEALHERRMVLTRLAEERYLHQSASA